MIRPSGSNRRKNRRARADDDARAALADLVPFVVAFTGGQVAVQHSDECLEFAGAEPRFESFDGLRRERNLRHKHNRSLALFERVCDGLQVNFGFARTGDAVKKESRGWRMENGGWFGLSIVRLQSSTLAAIHSRLDFLQRGGLRRIQRQRLRRQDVFAGVRIAFGNLRGNLNQAAILKFADGGGGGFGQFDQFLQRQLVPLLDDVPDFLLTLGQLRKFATHRQRADKQPLAPAGFLLAHGFGQDGFQRGFRRAAVVLGNPARKFQDLRRDERLCADNFQNRF